MILATIDVGTNTVLLLVARLEADGTLVPLVSEQRVPRLGQGVDARRNLHPDAMHRVVEAVQEYQHLIAAHHPDRIVLFGTSAVRDAANRDRLADLLEEATGLVMEVLAGQEEARWTFYGALSGAPGADRATVIDIGGGSTEITSGTRADIFHSASIEIGSVRITERLFRHDPPAGSELVEARHLIDGLLADARRSGAIGQAVRPLIGVAGTVTTLALLAQGRPTFDVSAVSGYTLTRIQVTELLDRLAVLPSERILALGSYMKGRHDIITAGALILLGAMRALEADEVVVSERGIRYGIALREAGRNAGRPG